MTHANQLLCYLRQRRHAELDEIATALDAPAPGVYQMLLLGEKSGYFGQEDGLWWITKLGRRAIIPEEGMVATLCVGSDRYSFEVVRWLSDKCIELRERKARRVDKNGMSEMQTWETESNPDGRLIRAKRTHDRDWKSDHGWIILGVDDPHIDPHF